LVASDIPNPIKPPIFLFAFICGSNFFLHSPLRRRSGIALLAETAMLGRSNSGASRMATIQAKSVRRREDIRLLTGQGNYAADAAPAGMAVAIFLRSPYAHARIEHIDTAPARNIAGVIAVYTEADLTDVAPIPGGIGFPRPDGGPAPKIDRKLLASDRVRFVGEPVALVIAESRAAGLEAAEAIVVDYAALPVVTEPVAAMRPGATPVWDDVPDNIGFLWKRGDADGADAALSRSEHVTTLDFTVSRVTANSMEPRGAWACIAGDGRIEVHASHQSPFALRNGMASGNFQIPPTYIRVLPGDVGGSFGMKSGVHLESVLG
jgi:carbon-monoxide dehydrogenase large subunit